MCLLLDEPLSNLDAKLRSMMRGEIRRLQKLLGINGPLCDATIREEALAVSDRIAVMRAGRVEQSRLRAQSTSSPKRPSSQASSHHNLLMARSKSRNGGEAEIAFAGTNDANQKRARQRRRRGRRVAAARDTCVCLAPAKFHRPDGQGSTARSVRSNISAR